MSPLWALSVLNMTSLAPQWCCDIQLCYESCTSWSTYAMQQQSQSPIFSSSFTETSAQAARGRIRRSSGSCGLSAAHSNSSSMSQLGNYPPFLSSSINSSVSDDSIRGSDIGSLSSRTLPRLSELIHGNISPVPPSMMEQISWVTSRTQKKLSTFELQKKLDSNLWKFLSLYAQEVYYLEDSIE